MTIGAKIKLLIKEKGINTLQLSNAIKIGNSAMYRIEKDENLPSADMIIKICKYFNISSDWLLGLSDEREIKNVSNE